MMPPFRRILVATDLTSASEAALVKAIELAVGGDTELLIAHAFGQPSLAAAESASPTAYDEWKRAIHSQVEKGLEPLIGRARTAGAPARPLVLSGIPDVAIVQAARECDVDLIVAGTHSRTGMSRILLGSVAARLVATAPCPVLTVRPETASAAGNAGTPPAA
jgi:universal stress protein A